MKAKKKKPSAMKGRANKPRRGAGPSQAHMDRVSAEMEQEHMRQGVTGSEGALWWDSGRTAKRLQDGLWCDGCGKDHLPQNCPKNGGEG